MRAALRSTSAVLAGLVTAGTVVLVFTAGTTWIFFGGDFQAEPTPLYVAFNLAYTFGGAVLGGWIAAKLGRRAAVLHGAALALLLALLTVLGGTGGEGMDVPAWYDAAVTLIGPVGALMGAVLVALKPNLYEPVDLPT